MAQIKSPHRIHDSCPPKSEFHFSFCLVLARITLAKPIRMDGIVDWQTNKVIEVVYFMHCQVNIQG